MTMLDNVKRQVSEVCPVLLTGATEMTQRLA